MPADLNNPFGPSCCDGGACNTPESAMPCGCDPGINYVSPFCEKHRPVPTSIAHFASGLQLDDEDDA